jgi:site-specific recombinase XerD
MGTLPTVELPAGFVSTTTIKVIARHCDACKEEHPKWKPEDNTCDCRKYIYIYENGKDRTYSAKTRSLERANKIVKEEENKRDPVQLLLREIKEREAAKEAADTAAKAAKTLTIKEATIRWTAFKKGKSEATRQVHRGVAKRIQEWANDNGIALVGDLTFNLLDKWRGEWGPDAEISYNRLDQTSQSLFLSYLKSFCRYMANLDYLVKDPAAGLGSIAKKFKSAQPLDVKQYEDLLAAIEPFCASQTGIVSGMAAEIRAEIQLQRWAGLRISDSVAFSRFGLVGNRISLTTRKTNYRIEGMVIPDEVAAELAALPVTRPGFKSTHYFWKEGRNTVHSLEGWWEEKVFNPLNAFLNFVGEDGQPMRFHTHMLRDTFAVELLLQGVPLEEVSKLLTHTSIGVTEKHYSPWVKARREKLERDQVEAMRKMGRKVSV